MVLVRAWFYPMARFFLAMLISGVWCLISFTDLQKEPQSWFLRISTLAAAAVFLSATVWMFRWYAKQYREGRRAIHRD